MSKGLPMQAMGTIGFVLCAALALASPADAGDSSKTAARPWTLLQCASFRTALGPDVIINKDLGTALCAYYDAENAADWEATYRMRPVSLRKIVPWHLYANHMEQHKQSLSITGMEIRSVSLAGRHTLLDIDFHEARDASDLKRSSCYGEITEWKRESSGWKCVSCGKRMRYFLNATAVHEQPDLPIVWSGPRHCSSRPR